MKNKLVKLAFSIKIEKGEKLITPDLISQDITIQPDLRTSIRTHDAFLNSYVPEDEGLYDDY